MDTNQQILATLLSQSIHNQYTKKIKDINLENIFQEAVFHEVQTLLYPLIKNLYATDITNLKIFTEWGNMAIIGGISQIQAMNEIRKVLSAFNNLGIQVIILKGLVLKRLYPRPELRSMCDADILIHKADVNEAKQLLLSLGYIEYSSNSIHIHFHHENFLPIELHWALINEDHIKTAKDFEDRVWENIVPINFSGAKAFALSSENQLLHLCLHMGTHIIKSGFGLRQLCDLVLVVEAEKNTIDWRSFYERSKINGIYTFVVAIFTVCNQLFDMELPNNEYFSFVEDSYFINILINDIFSGGVLGNKDISRINSNSILGAQNHQHPNNLNYNFIIALSFLFPSSKKLDKRYFYAKKLFFLTPIAWLHRFFYNLFSKNINTLEKILHFKASTSIAQNRSELIHWLDLL